MPEQNPTGGSKEFFYLDEAGQKQDADLHGPILRAVDFPIDEKMMAPIRARHRAKAKTIGGVPSQRGYPEFDPNQPRDEGGRFGSGGGGSESGGGKAPGKAPSKPSSSKGSAKAVRGLPNDFEIKDKALKQALERDAFEISAKPSTHFGKDSYDLTVLAKEVPGVERYVVRPTRGKEGQYDPRLAVLETHSKGEEYLEFTVAKLKPGLSDKITPLSAPDIVYRGMSAEEYESIQKTGVIRSSGAYNIGEAQEGLTYWTTDPEAAVGYASGFAPWAYKPTFEKPAYVVAVKRPKDVRPVAGVGEHEVGVVGAVDKEEIVGTWIGEVYAFNAGEMNLRADGSIGSSTAPSAQLAWKQVGEKAAALAEEPAEEPQSERATHNKTVLTKARAVAKQHDYDPAKITLGADKGPERDFVLNGKTYKAAGLAYIHDGTGRIKLFAGGLSLDGVEGVTVHEIMHHKWEQVFTAYKAESKAVRDLAAPHSYRNNPVMNADDTLKPPYDKQFPIYHRLHPFLAGDSWHKLIDEDGASAYSDEYWKERNKPGGSFKLDSAVHETLAEIGRLEHESPGYIDRVIRLRTGPWGKFYRAVIDVHKGLPK